MKVSSEMFQRWMKYSALLLAEHNYKFTDVDSPVKAWNVAHRLSIPAEAYHVGLNDNHIETALKRIFTSAWGKQGV